MRNKSFNVYPYAWLDEVIEITLNPEKTKVADLQSQQLEIIESKFDQELQEVLKDLKTNTFYLFSFKKIKAVVTQYYDSLMLLEHQAVQNLSAYPDDHPLAATGENIVLYIRDMGLAFKKRYGKYIVETTNAPNNTPPRPGLISKILCKLSADQIGIILKAADDTKVVIASSLSLVFRTIVPYLSTDKIKNISWDSMRKSTYRIEQTDKDAAIATLEKLIIQIRNY
ncbi:hypothetical protein GS399_13665 [Pedobacter sp. HMF7647]|uniref:Uncharacterized protein n=1 Tax=Hufsiella arboris TaxID=2695275 RepID=A0A7K1YBQ1_9SPHI|nr:hypothetical protein [Hufsiella arboris]MXV52024.1 hypothetical protein [Hufsiella arboris]